jgi:hypothetical protein
VYGHYIDVYAIVGLGEGLVVMKKEEPVRFGAYDLWRRILRGLPRERFIVFDELKLDIRSKSWLVAIKYSWVAGTNGY